MEGLPQRIPTFSRIYTLSQFCKIFIRLPIGVAFNVHEWGVATIVLQIMALSTAIFSSQPAEYKLVSLCMVHNLSGFSFLCFHFLVSGKREGEREPQGNPSLSALLFSFFSSRVYCHVSFQTEFRSAMWNQKCCIRTLTVLRLSGNCKYP